MPHRFREIKTGVIDLKVRFLQSSEQKRRSSVEGFILIAKMGYGNFLKPVDNKRKLFIASRSRRKGYYPPFRGIYFAI